MANKTVEERCDNERAVKLYKELKKHYNIEYIINFINEWEEVTARLRPYTKAGRKK